MSVKQLDGYIRRVIIDACEGEERENDVEFQYKIIEGYFLFAVKSKYIRVVRKIVFRLRNNLKKRFNLEFNLVFPFLHGEEAGSRLYDLFSRGSGIDPNYSFMEWEVFGKMYTIRSMCGLLKDNDCSLPHLNRLKEYGYNYENHGETWDNFERAYKAAYGESPYESMVKMKEYYAALREGRGDEIGDSENICSSETEGI